MVDLDTAVLGDATIYTQTGEQLGAPGFMAPELMEIRGLPPSRKRSCLVGVYSLGAVAYFTLIASASTGDEPDPSEEGGRYLYWPLSKLVADSPEGLAGKVIDTLHRFWRCLAPRAPRSLGQRG